ncbi:MAG: nucleotidyltransferase domain-containing protein [Prevotella sp.]|nr:nucleotidyltransferase domain-containing protein [Prevotella sp.]
MKQTNEYINLIKAHSDEIRTQFGVRTLRLFGSVSRGEQHEGSDVDVIRMHKHIRPYLLQNIEHDGIYVIGEA